MAHDPEDTTPRIPELEKDYTLIRELGRGGTAVVYLARDRELARSVAIKLIRPSYVADEDALARLEREAQTVGRMQHPNIVMLLGSRRLGDRGLALILQYVPGRSLKDLLQEEGPLPFERAEAILTDIAKALAYAHRRRIVHRDLKPENVYLDEDAGIARLADFGIARAWDSDSGLTLPGTALGTPAYMSPEQLEGGDLDGRSDVYSFGLLGHEILTGRRPWEGESLYSIINKQKHEDLPPLEEARPGTPAHLATVVHRALRKDPAERWNDGSELLRALLDPPRAPAPPSPPELDPFSWGEPVPADPGPPVWPPPELVERMRARDAEPAIDEPDDPQQEVPPAQPTSPDAATDSGPREGAPPAPAPLPPDADEQDGRDEQSGVLVEEPGERRRSTPILAAVMALLLLGVGITWAAGAPDGQLRTFLGDLMAGGGPPPGDPLEDEPFGAWRDRWGDPGSEDTPAAPEPSADPSRDLAGPEAGRLVSGSGQIAPPGQPLADAIIFELLDEDGTPRAGLEVVLAAEPAGALLEPAQARTDERGRVAVRWTLAPTPGPQRLVARAAGSGGGELARAEAIAGPGEPSTLQRATPARQEARPGVTLEEPLAVRLIDESGIPVPGRWIRFRVESGGGALDADSVLTSGAGMARVQWTTGPGEGEQRVSARLVDAEEVMTIFDVVTAVPALAVRSGVVTGGTHSCLLAPTGSLVCWGDNGRGQLGTPGARRLSPGPGVTGGPWTRVSAGVAHACALDREGGAHCWGANDRGQLGTGDTTPSDTPRPVAGEHRFTEIAAGAGHSCALRSDGVVLCWGDNARGQLGLSGGASSAPTEVERGLRFRSLASGWNHVCALDGAGVAWCWGGNSSGELGSGEVGGSRPTPERVAGQGSYVEIKLGNAHGCARRVDGRVECWGDNSAGQLGDGTNTSRSSPAPVSGERRFTSVAVGAVHSCAIGDDGGALCWGRNLYGQVGDGSEVDRNSPVAVEGSVRFAELHAFGSHSCGRTPGGEVFCWGYNAEGQLGDGTRENRSRPVPLANRE